MAQSQMDISQTVHVAAVPISREISAMIAALPAGTDPAELALELIYSLASMTEHPEFIGVFTEALAARHALIKLGIKL
jgi:hypothetical protein